MHRDQDLHSHHTHTPEFTLVYNQNLHPYDSSPSSYVLSSEIPQPRFRRSDAFGSPPGHEQHEAEHVYNSPPLALDPSTLNLRSNSDDLAPSSSANPSGSNSSTPTGTVRLSSYSLPSTVNSNGVTTRRRARAALGQLHIPPDVGIHTDAETHSQLAHRDMQDIRIHSCEDVHMPNDDHTEPNFSSHSNNSTDHEGQGGTTPHARDIYSLLPGSNTQSHYYISSNSDGFPNSPISPPSPPESSRDRNLQTSPSLTLEPPASASASLVPAFRPGPLPLGLSANRSIPLIQSSSNHPSPVQQQISPSHMNPPQLSAHPHMHPAPYYSLQHQSVASPGFPSTPTASHHTQGSSSSSHSSGHTRYSFHDSPGPPGFGSRHARSSSFGTVSTVSVRSSSPANSVASAFTSLSGGGGGSAPASATGPVGSPTSYGETAREVSNPFGNTSPPSRAQSHPPLSMPTAHPALTPYSALLHPPRKSLLPSENTYLPTPGDHFSEEHRQPVAWTLSPDDYSPSSGPRMTDEEFHLQYRPKPVVARTPHRKQKLANSDRKAICMYAKQHPNARQEDIAARYNVERSTISKILKNKERWLGCPDDEAKVARKRKPRFDDLELVLKMWVEETREQGILLSDALIRSKAKEEARQLGISEEKFKASSGWLENFKHRVGIRKGKYVGREQWVGASDSDAEEQRLTQEELHKRIIFMMDPQPGYERAPKGMWRMPVSGLQRPEQQHVMQSEQALVPVQRCEAAQDQASGLPASPPRTCIDERSSEVGMRKTRSRTLAEAREAALTDSSPSQALSPAANASSTDSLPSFPPPSSLASQSPTTTALPDGREASAGLDVALDFIGGQPAGFATPEEVAVLQKLSRRMSQTESPNQHAISSGPGGWNGAAHS